MNGVAATDAAWQRCARDVRRQLRSRRDDNGANVFGPIEFCRDDRAIVLHATRDETAAQRRGDVVRVTFEFGGVVLNCLIAYFARR